jgi:hypothetical protein
VALALGVACHDPALANPTAPEVEAALIFNLTKFVDWPATAFASPGAPFVVAVIGQDDVSDVLVLTLSRKSVDGRPLLVRRVRGSDAVGPCQMLYVAASERRHADAIIAAFRGSGTLTVSGIERFAERGGDVALVLANERVQIVVNLARTQESHLSVSSRLLAVARVVGSTP